MNIVAGVDGALVVFPPPGVMYSQPYNTTCTRTALFPEISGVGHGVYSTHCWSIGANTIFVTL